MLGKPSTSYQHTNLWALPGKGSRKIEIVLVLGRKRKLKATHTRVGIWRFPWY